MLRDNQDPQALEARVAFHLHRLNRTGQSLVDCGFATQKHAAALVTQGRRPINMAGATSLASSLGIPVDEITRLLTQQEASEWLFYRISARHPHEPWKRAHNLWQEAGITNQAAARIIQVDSTNLSRAIRHQPLKHRRNVIIMNFPQAHRLTTALSIAEGPFVLLEGLSLMRDEPPGTLFDGR